MNTPDYDQCRSSSKSKNSLVLGETWIRCHNGSLFSEAQDIVLDEEEYRLLQKQSPIDKGTWSWLKTPADTRKTGNALYGYCADGGVYVFLSDAYLHHDDRGFRCVLRVPKI